MHQGRKALSQFEAGPAIDGSRAATSTAVAAPIDRPHKPMRDTYEKSKFSLR